MEVSTETTLIALIQTTAGLGLLAVGFWLAQRINRLYGDTTRQRAKELLDNARREADTTKTLANAEAQRLLRSAQDEIEEVKARAQEQLEKCSSISQVEARQLLLDAERERIAAEAADLERSILSTAQQHASTEAQRLIVMAIERCATHTTANATTAIIPIPSEEMKGRLIGKDGRNFRSFERITGVNLVVDETPGSVMISSHDPTRRHVASMALTRLIEDGRIHPGRIEEEVLRARNEARESAIEDVKSAFRHFHLSLPNERILETLSLLKYRQSWAQNVLEHSMETASILGTLADELHLHSATARRIGLLHDIGKALPSHEGPHALSGAALLKRHGESEEVVHAVSAHHREVEPRSLFAHLLIAADAISASRPGARNDQTQLYFERMTQLEDLALKAPGVEQAFAIQGGRELRVFVNAAQLDDDASAVLARTIALRIQENIAFPGPLRVVVVRETRCIEHVRQGQA